MTIKRNENEKDNNKFFNMIWFHYFFFFPPHGPARPDTRVCVIIWKLLCAVPSGPGFSGPTAFNTWANRLAALLPLSWPPFIPFWPPAKICSNLSLPLLLCWLCDEKLPLPWLCWPEDDSWLTSWLNCPLLPPLLNTGITWTLPLLPPPRLDVSIIVVVVCLVT